MMYCIGSDVPALAAWLEDVGVPPERLTLVVNTHYHSDHVGGNHALQRDYGTEVAAHAWEADAVNRRDPDAARLHGCGNPSSRTTWGDGCSTATCSTPGHGVGVLHTPGHTAGHVSLYAPAARVLVAGDTAHATDVGWLKPYLEGADALERSLDTLARLASLAPSVALFGHGPVIDGFAAPSPRPERHAGHHPAGAHDRHADKHVVVDGLKSANGLGTIGLPFSVAQRLMGGIPDGATLADLLLWSERRRIPDHSTIWDASNAACQKTEVREVQLYDTRHTHATTPQGLGGNVKAIAARLGHDASQLLTVYAHVMAAGDADLAALGWNAGAQGVPYGLPTPTPETQ